MVRVLACQAKGRGFKSRFSRKCSLFRLVVRTLPFHGKNTGSSPVRDILKDLKYFIENWKFFKAYWFELKFITFYNMILFCSLFCVCYMHMDSLLYLLSKYLLLHIESSKFFFSHISQLFWVYLHIALWISFLIGLPFFIFNYILYMLAAFIKREFSKVLKTFFFFWVCYYNTLLLTNVFVIPAFLDFFLGFNNTDSGYFAIHFEAKFEEYFALVILIFFRLELFFICIFIFFYFNFIGIIKDSTLIQNRFYLYLIILLISLFLCPPDILSQLFYILFFWIFFEFLVFLKFLYKSLFI